jgi:hypothetical protein
MGTTVALWTIDQKSIEHDGIRNGIALLAQLLSSPTIWVVSSMWTAVSVGTSTVTSTRPVNMLGDDTSDSCSGPAPDDQASAVLFEQLESLSAIGLWERRACDRLVYSCRSAVSGSMRAARRAGR